LDCVIDHSVCSGVVSFEFGDVLLVAHFRKVVRVTVPSLALTKMAQNSASATEYITCLSTVVWQISGPLMRGVADEFVVLQR
jgi:hypothetical protein